VNPDTLQPQIDEAATHKALYETFRYSGLFTPDGSWDSAVYKDENSETLSRNYMAAHLQLAFVYRRRGEIARAVAETERAARMFPHLVEVQIPLGIFYLDLGDTLKAAELFARLASNYPNNPEVRYYHGATRLARGDLATALREFDAAIQLDPDYNLAYYAAYSSLMERGEREHALSYIERWVASHPGDADAGRLLDAQRRALGQAPPNPVLPPPSRPELP
jgi:tetratricopeptide (TPR) repeat protein